MDILYIYNGWKDSESLRYSMRSIAKFGKNVGNVFLLSELVPKWCSDKVKHIYYKSDPKLYKENDITNALFKAIENAEVPDRFLICADDYFYIRDTDFDNYPIYLKGNLPKEADASMGGWKYVRSLINTRALLTAAGLPTANYGGHCCFYADRPLMNEFSNIFRAAYLLEYGATFDSLMANIMVDKLGMERTARKDNKIETATSIDDLKAKIGDTECFSTATRIMDRNIRRILAELFNEPCCYERG